MHIFNRFSTHNKTQPYWYFLFLGMLRAPARAPFAEIETHESCKIALPLVSFLASEIRRGINCHFTQPVFYSNNNNGNTFSASNNTKFFYQKWRMSRTKEKQHSIAVVVRFYNFRKLFTFPSKLIRYLNHFQIISISNEFLVRIISFRFKPFRM